MIKCILIPKSERGQICLKRQNRMEIESCKKFKKSILFALIFKIYIWIRINSYVSSVQLLSCVRFFEIPWTAAPQASPVHHQFPEFFQTHVHWVGDAIKSSHTLSSPSPPALNLSQIRVFLNESVHHIRWPKDWNSASVSVLPMNIQDWFPWGWTGWISLQSKGLSRVFSKTTVQKHQFFGAQLSS